MLKRLLRATAAIVILVLAAAGVAIYIFGYYPLRDPHPPAFRGHGVLAIRHTLVYTGPDAAPLQDVTVLVRDGRIAAIGSQVEVPPDAEELPCSGCVVTAGFWNAHVHFTEPKWFNAEWKPASVLNAQLGDMLTSRGFTTVVDTGSDPRVTVPLRRRIESGELLGPAIYTAGAAQYPPHGVPFYLRDTLPAYLLPLLPQPANPQDAASVEEQNIRNGADLLKLFTGSYVERGKVLPMPEANAAAAVEVAHRHGQLAFAHPSDADGARVAIASGVDVLAHAIDTTEGVDEAFLQTALHRQGAPPMAMIPTLKMFRTTVTTNPAYLDPIYAQVREFHALGGELLFGTDVGYMTDYTTEDEFTALGKCGLDAHAILRMLTTAPAGRFGVLGSKGRIVPGAYADLVVLDADPSADVRAFAQVAETVRAGRVVYHRR